MLEGLDIEIEIEIEIVDNVFEGLALRSLVDFRPKRLKDACNALG